MRWNLWFDRAPLNSLLSPLALYSFFVPYGEGSRYKCRVLSQNLTFFFRSISFLWKRGSVQRPSIKEKPIFWKATIFRFTQHFLLGLLSSEASNLIIGIERFHSDSRTLMLRTSIQHLCIYRRIGHVCFHSSTGSSFSVQATYPPAMSVIPVKPCTCTIKPFS